MSYAHLIRVSLVGILAFAIVITLDSDSGVNVYDNPEFEIFMKTLTSHEPISINNDIEFALQAVYEGWSGNGTPENPYIIENYSISAGGAHGIHIKNTTAYFIIKNCTISDGKTNHYHSIYFCNVANGKIDNVTLWNNAFGIYFDNVSNTEIINSTADNNEEGIYINSSWYINITNCDMHNNEVGSRFESSSSNKLLNCTIRNNSIYGMFFYNSTDNQIKKCISQNNKYGVYFWTSLNNTLVSSMLYDNLQYGIYLWTSPHNKITNCELVNDGIVFCENSLEDCVQIIENVTVNGKPLYYFLNQNSILLDGANTGQLILVNCTNSLINNLDISYTDAGIELLYSSNITLANSAIYNTFRGVFLSSSKNNTIDCIAYNNSYGVELWGSSNNKLENCIIENNSQGICLHLSSNNQIINSSLHSSGYGVYFCYSSNNTIAHSIIHNTSRGVHLAFLSASNQIANCSLYNNGCGVYSFGGSNNKIYYCNIFGNLEYGCYNHFLSPLLNASYNWWGAPDGPGGVGNGSGDNVSGKILYEPWLAEPNPEAGLLIPTPSLGNITEIKIIPEGPINLYAGDTQQFTAAAYDQYGNINTSWAPHWHVNGEIGTINDTGFFKATKKGAGAVNCTDNVTGVYNISIVNVLNSAPILATIENQTAYEGQAFTLQVNAIDPDDDTLTFSDNSILFDINSTSGLISFTPGYESAGIYWVNITVSDGADVDWQIFKLEIIHTNRRPIAIISSPLNNSKFTTSDSISFDASGSYDLDNDTLNYTWSSNIDGIIGYTKSFSAKLSAGTHTITLAVSDGNLSATKQITITVEKPPERPWWFISADGLVIIGVLCAVILVIVVLRKLKGV